MFNNRIGDIKYLVATDAVSSHSISKLINLDWHGLESKHKEDYLFEIKQKHKRNKTIYK